ncbi:MAG TPA: hypothetical protein VEB59_13585 [Gemmatimonadales bacterium]|nr:hypothetical protein [Gemmatimonadales bacterium]
MYRASLAAAALACAAFISACGDRAAPTESASREGPDLRTTRNPDGPGAVVDSGELPFTFFFTDPASGLGIVAGLTPETLPGFCADEDVERGTSIVRGVIRPDGSLVDHERSHKVSVMVFLDDDQDLCDGSAPFAIGTANFFSHDNDFFVSGDRTNSFGFRLNGQVIDVNGGRHHVSAAFQGNVGRGGDVRVTRSGIELR